MANYNFFLGYLALGVIFLRGIISKREISEVIWSVFIGVAMLVSYYLEKKKLLKKNTSRYLGCIFYEAGGLTFCAIKLH